MNVRNLLVSNTLDSSGFEDLLLNFRYGWTEGTLAAECARVLQAEEKRQHIRPELLDFRHVDSLPLTKRFDGMIHLWVPIAKNVSDFADEILAEAFRLELPLPSRERLDELRRAISLCYFAFLHGRSVRIDLGMRMELKLSCPTSPTGGTRKQPLLLGHLPFGGTSTTLKTEWSANELLTVPGHEVQYCPRLQAHRDDSGLLMLHEAPSTSPVSLVEPV